MAFLCDQSHCDKQNSLSYHKMFCRYFYTNLACMKCCYHFSYIQTAYDLVKDTCMEMGLHSEQEHGEYALFTLLEQGTIMKIT